MASRTMSYDLFLGTCLLIIVTNTGASKNNLDGTPDIASMLDNVEQDTKTLVEAKIHPSENQRLEISELNYDDKVRPERNEMTTAAENGKVYLRGEGKIVPIRSNSDVPSFTYYPLTPDLDEFSELEKKHKKINRDK